MADIEADVIIVGSGISGALLAARLADAGVKVAILEAGARVDRAQATQRFWDAPIKVPECPYPPSPQANHPISNDPDYWYRQVGPDKFKSTYVKVVGGTTWHWLGTCLRLVPNDFRLSTAYGRGVDWPIAYADLEPFYGQAEDEIGVSGDSDETLGSPRSTGYPMPAIPQTFLDKAYARALAGTQYEVRATPQGRNSADRDDRPACCGNASCIPICPIQAKYDATVHLARAEKRGAAIHAQTTATMVEVGSRRAGHRDSLQAVGRQRRHRLRQGLRARRTCDRDSPASAEFAHGGQAERRGQQLRPGRPQSDGPSDAAELGAGANAGVALPGAAIDLRHREPSGRPVPQGAAGVSHRDRQRRLVVAHRGADDHCGRTGAPGFARQSLGRRLAHASIPPHPPRLADRAAA